MDCPLILIDYNFNKFITLIFNLKTQDLPVTHSHCDSKSLSEAPIQNPVFSICCDVRTCCRKVWRLSFLIWIRSPPSLRHRFRATSQSIFSKLNWRHSWSKVARFSGKSESGQPAGLWINAADAVQKTFPKIWYVDFSIYERVLNVNWHYYITV